MKNAAILGTLMAAGLLASGVTLYPARSLAAAPRAAAARSAAPNPRQIAEKGLLTLRAHTRGVTCLAFSPDGKWLASGSADHTIALWDTASGKLVRRLEGHRSEVTGLTFSPDGKWLVSVGAERGIVEWSTATWRIETIAYASNMCYAVHFFPDSKRFVISSVGFQVWTVGEDAPTGAFDIQDWSPRFIIAKDGEIITGNDFGTVSEWDSVTGDRKSEHQRPMADLPRATGDSKNRIMGVAECPNGHILVGDISGLWDWDRHNKTFTWIGRDVYDPVAVTADGRIVIGRSDKSVWFRDSDPSPVVLDFHLVFQPHGIALSDDGAQFAYAGRGEWSDEGWRSGGPAEVRLIRMANVRAGIAAQRATEAKGKNGKPTPDPSILPAGTVARNKWGDATTLVAPAPTPDILP